MKKNKKAKNSTNGLKRKESADAEKEKDDSDVETVPDEDASNGEKEKPEGNSNAEKSETSSSISSSSSTNGSDKKPMGILEKLKAAEPLNFFLTKIRDSPGTHAEARSIYIADLLHPRLGDLKRTLQINFMVEWDWLRMNYEVTKNDSKPLLILHGEDNPDLRPANLPDNVKAVRIRSKYPYGTHHTKIMLLHYEDDSVRVVVSTANLVSGDWENRTQGLWVSPRCPRLEEEEAESAEAKGEAKTGFKAAFLRYLKYYEVSPLRTYIETVKCCDFSAVNVFFVASVPNAHKGRELDLWGHKAVAAILRKHLKAKSVDKSWPLVMQCSSIGSLGNNEALWFKGEFAQTLSTTTSSTTTASDVSVVYPSKSDVFQSHDGLLGGGCLPYSRRTHEKQIWLEKYFCRWRAHSTHRNRAMPHIKTYTRLSPDTTSSSSFFLLTSANLSKAAWGSLNKAKDSLLVMSYEAGVIFLPEFVYGKEVFELGSEISLPYDVPLTPYTAADTPWFMDILRESMM